MLHKSVKPHSTGIIYLYKKDARFRGYLKYKMKEEDQISENPWNKTTHMLARYAEYANIGGNKTAAYGQTKLQIN